MKNFTRSILLVTVFFTILSVRSGWASSFSVEPVRVKLDVQHRTERLTVKNESDLPLTLLIKSYRWTQADKGTDLYDETEDLIIFPRALTLAAGEERFIRVGIASQSGTAEQAFRIYLQEQPVRDEMAPKGASARILMRLGIPVFAQPLKPEPALKVKVSPAAKGHLSLTLVNPGNSFVTPEQITISGLNDKGAELFARNLGGFYLLAGSARTFEVAIPKDKCRKVNRISVTTRNEGKEQHDMLDMTFEACESK